MVGMVVRLGIDGRLPLAKALERVVGVMADVETLLRHIPPTQVSSKQEKNNPKRQYMSRRHK
jgi:hypothetical protein